VQLSLEAEILLRPRAVEEGGLAVQAALGQEIYRAIHSPPEKTATSPSRKPAGI